MKLLSSKKAFLECAFEAATHTQVNDLSIFYDL